MILKRYHDITIFYKIGGDRFAQHQFFLSHGYEAPARVSSDHDELVRRRMEARATHDRSKRFSRYFAEELALGVENFHATRFLHAARTKHVHFGMPPCLEGCQPSTWVNVVIMPTKASRVRSRRRNCLSNDGSTDVEVHTCLIVVPNSVVWFDRFATLYEMCILGQIQFIGKRRGQ